MAAENIWLHVAGHFAFQAIKSLKYQEISICENGYDFRHFAPGSSLLHVACYSN